MQRADAIGSEVAHGAEQMQFGILGPLAVHQSGAVVDITGPKQRALLIYLLLHANEIVSTDRIVDALYGDELTGREEGTLRVHITNLRRVLEPSRAKGEHPRVLVTRAPGYSLRTDRDAIDAGRFERLVGEGRRALEVDPELADDRFTEGLSLWRGDALEDVAYESFAQDESDRLESLRMAALEDRIEARLGLGQHLTVAGELETLIREQPLRERLYGLLMLAHYRSGRQAEALRLFQQARGTLGAELGIEVSPQLRRLEAQMLQQDPELDLPSEMRRHERSGPLEPGRSIRGFELRERIGAGYFGEVFRAYQPAVGREVALKVVRPEHADAPEFIRSFHTEAQIVARLEHPHIVPLYDYWREPSRAYLVMRWLKGGSLRQALDRGPFRPEATLQAVEQVASALDAAHRQGVIHRDVKPTNILFDDRNNAYLSDFGIAVTSIVDFEGEERSTLSPPYSSPELLQREAASPQSDIFSVGVITWEMLTGRRFADSIEEGGTGINGYLPPLEVTGLDQRAAGEVLAVATARLPTERYPDSASFVQALRSALGSARQAVSRPRTAKRNPYKGLAAFQEADGGDFFGREAITRDLVDQLGQSQVVAVVGPSGSGKSSLVRAGLVPALRGGALDGSERWLVLSMVPGRQPFEEFYTALNPIAVEAPKPRGVPAPKDDRELLRALDRGLPAGAQVVLIIDQFEELFALTPEMERDRFIANLVTLLQDDVRVRLAMTVRADYYDRPLRYRTFGRIVADNSVTVTALTPSELERAIVRPADRAGVALEPGLVAELVNEVADQPGGLPLLQYALAELFDRRRQDELTVDAYRQIGGVMGALGSRADDLYRELGDHQATVRQVFLRLVALGEGAGDTRRRVLITELEALSDQSAVVTEVVETYGAHRILTFDHDPVTRTPSVEIAHEALLTRWSRLAVWVSDAREDLMTHGALATAVHAWESAGRDPDYLVRGKRLTEFEELAADGEIDVNADEMEYLDAALGQRASEEQHSMEETKLRGRARRRLWGLVALIALVIGAAAVWLGVAWLSDLPTIAVIGTPEDDTESEGTYMALMRSGLNQAAAVNDFEPLEVKWPWTDYDAVLRNIAQVADLVITPEWWGTEAGASEANPDTTFVVLDRYPRLNGLVENEIGISYATHEGGFMAGAAAGLVSKTGIVGFIGHSAADDIDGPRAGFFAGARHVDPAIEVISIDVRGSPDFEEANRISKEAAVQLYAMGADVIYEYTAAQGDGVVTAAYEQSGATGVKRWVIGGGDGSNRIEHVAPEEAPHVLTSIVRRIDVLVASTISNFVSGELTEEHVVHRFGDSGLGLGTLNGPLVGLASELEAIQAGIRDGSIEVPRVPVDRAIPPVGFDTSMASGRVVITEDRDCLYSYEGPDPYVGLDVVYEVENNSDVPVFFGEELIWVVPLYVSVAPGGAMPYYHELNDPIELTMECIVDPFGPDPDTQVLATFKVAENG